MKNKCVKDCFFMEKNYKLTIAYDGSRYNGWQRQLATQNTIQGKIEAVLSVLYGHNIEINGSGRTDAGVHAKCQVANYKASDDYTCDYIKDYLNTYLPEDIAITSVSEEDLRFHARLCVKKKIYEYRILNSNVSDVFNRKYVFQIKENLDVDKMKLAAAKLIGTHDFLGFSSLKKAKKSTVRTIYSIDIEKTDSQIIFTFCGDGFLYNMVRILTGTLVEIGKGNEIDIDGILNGLERCHAGATLPAKGLCLANVIYQED